MPNKQLTIMIFVIVLLLVALFYVQPVPPSIVAQDDATPSTTIHIVQRGESLSQIAELYSTTVEVLMANNDIADARYIEVGQQIVVPNNPQQVVQSAGFSHTVQATDTLARIATAYAVAYDDVVTLNGITHPYRLYLGQVLQIGEIGRRSTEYRSYIVQPSDTWARVAARSGISVQRLQSLNPQYVGVLVQGLVLIVPLESTLPEIAPSIDYNIQPSQPAQGQSVRVQISPPPNATLEGYFMGRSMDFAQQTDGSMVSIIAVHALAAPAVYPIELVYTNSIGERQHHEIRIQVVDGGYGQEAINIGPELSGLLEPSLVQTELDHVAAVMTNFSREPLFDGVFSLPAAGVITSNYGTRRSYNGSPYDNNFHGGTDFGGAVGSPITAPADGIVVMSEPLEVRGNVVILDHGWGVYTGYWHLTERSVEVGQRVVRGEVIGLLGSTGLVTGAHLHWEMWVQDVQVSPMQWVEQSFR